MCCREMAAATNQRFPLIVRAGEARVRVENGGQWQDVVALAALGGAWATSEPLLDIKCDVVVQKIGANVRSYA